MAIQVWNKQTVLSATNSAIKFLQINPSLESLLIPRRKLSNPSLQIFAFVTAPGANDEWCPPYSILIYLVSQAHHWHSIGPAHLPKSRLVCTHHWVPMTRAPVSGQMPRESSKPSLFWVPAPHPSSHTPAHPPSSLVHLIKACPPPGGTDLGLRTELAFLTPGMARWKEPGKSHITQCWQGINRWALPFTTDGSINSPRLSGGQFVFVYQNQNCRLFLLLDPKITHVGLYPKKNHQCAVANAYLQSFL